MASTRMAPAVRILLLCALFGLVACKKKQVPAPPTGLPGAPGSVDALAALDPMLAEAKRQSKTREPPELRYVELTEIAEDGTIDFERPFASLRIEVDFGTVVVQDKGKRLSHESHASSYPPIPRPRCRAKDLFQRARAAGVVSARIGAKYWVNPGPPAGPTWEWSGDGKNGWFLDAECAPAAR